MKRLIWLTIAAMLCQACTGTHHTEKSDADDVEPCCATPVEQAQTPEPAPEPEVDTSNFPRSHGLILVMEPEDALSEDGKLVVRVVRDFEAHSARIPTPPFPPDRENLTREEGKLFSAWYKTYHLWLSELNIPREEFYEAIANLESQGKADKILVHFAMGLTFIDVYTRVLGISAPMQSFGCDGNTPSTTLFVMTEQSKKFADELREVPPRSLAAKYSKDAIEEHGERVDALFAKTIKLDDYCDMQYP